MQPIAYLAGPLGFSEIGRKFHNEVLIPLVRGVGFDVRDPWTLTPKALIDSTLALPYGEERKRKWKEVNKIIGRNNTIAIRESNIIVAVLDGVDVDSGTAAEIGYAAALGKPTLGYRGDFRLSADNEGSIVNLQVEYFIRHSLGEIVADLESLKAALIMFLEIFKINPDPIS